MPGSNRLQIRKIFGGSGDRLTVFRVDNSGIIKFHNISEDKSWMKAVTSHLTELSIHDGNPDCIIEVDNVAFVPGLNCLYDSDGHKIIESTTRRGLDLDEIIDAPETIELPECASSIDLPVVYLGVINYHWGHFLTESISRLWSLDRHTSTENHLLLLGGVHNGDTSCAVNYFLDAVKVEHELYKGVTEPIKVRKAFVPLASFSNRGQAYSAHIIFPHKLAERLLGSWTPKVKSNRPVYLSRSRLFNRRLIRNEVEFENFLKSHGMLVCYPETMSLQEQIWLFNGYTTFIGCWGSALHNLIFCVDVTRITLHIMSGWRINPNYFLFDAISGLESHYINCLRPTPGVQELHGPMIDMYIEINLMRSYLAENQMI
jgi:hypothetical protein